MLPQFPAPFRPCRTSLASRFQTPYGNGQAGRLPWLYPEDLDPCHFVQLSSEGFTNKSNFFAVTLTESDFPCVHILPLSRLWRCLEASYDGSSQRMGTGSRERMGSQTQAGTQNAERRRIRRIGTTGSCSRENRCRELVQQNPTETSPVQYGMIKPCLS